MRTLVLHENGFEQLSELHCSVWEEAYRVKAHVTLHLNQFSCRVPDLHGLGKDSEAQVTLGMGNHFTHPGEFPTWVMPAERKGLFWVPPAEGRRILLEFLAGVALLIGCVASVPKFVWTTPLPSVWHDQIGKASGAMILHAWRQAVRSCIVLILVVGGNWRACPSVLAQASACLTRSKWVHRFVLALWYATAKKVMPQIRLAAMNGQGSLSAWFSGRPHTGFWKKGSHHEV